MSFCCKGNVFDLAVLLALPYTSSTTLATCIIPTFGVAALDGVADTPAPINDTKNLVYALLFVSRYKSCLPHNHIAHELSPLYIYIYIQYSLSTLDYYSDHTKSKQTF